jgi:exoribonuclease-2
MVSVMKSGNIVEYIDQQKIMCAVVLEVKKQRLRLLTETNREVNLSASRLSYRGEIGIDLSQGRDKLVENLKEIASRRDALTACVDIKELWDILNTEQEWIDLATMTEFCFPDEPDQDHKSAVMRAFFKNRLYFKFNNDQFFPHSEEKVEQISAQAQEAARRNRLIALGGDWIKKILKEYLESPSKESWSEDEIEIIEILKSYYLFETESRHYALARAMLSVSGIKDKEEIFRLLVKLGIWHVDENIDLLKHEIPVFFSEEITGKVNELLQSFTVASIETGRRDLTTLPLMTIDGQFTLDFDDALSLEEKDGYFLLGVHIADTGNFIRKGDRLDLEAMARGSSIYMPDQKISMVPTGLAENLCSLKAGEIRPAISTMIQLNSSADVIDYEIFPSLVKVQQQLTYYDVNLAADENREISILYDVAKKFRQMRLDNGAVQISLPEVNIWIDNDKNLNVAQTNRESPGRMLVAEIMIMANWMMARFLAEHHTPAIFRSQPEPRERLFKNNQGSLFQNWMQRKNLSRFVLSHEPESHTGLGLEAYVTATSPIRKYFDLATQRQIRAILGLEIAYSADEIQRIIQLLEQPTAMVPRIQYTRNRYWLLKYLEGKIGQKEKALVLTKMKKNYLVLLTEYMIECSLPSFAGIQLKSEDVIRVTIQHVDARKDLLSVYLS